MNSTRKRLTTQEENMLKSKILELWRGGFTPEAIALQLKQRVDAIGFRLAAILVNGDQNECELLISKRTRSIVKKNSRIKNFGPWEFNDRYIVISNDDASFTLIPFKD